MKKILIKNARIVNEGSVTEGDLYIEGERIARIDNHISQKDNNTQIIDAAGRYLLPGLIDDQVHFREPGLTHKANIGTESRAAVAGGITSYIEQPNTVPPAVTLELLEDKYNIAGRTSIANYGFNLGATNDNIDELQKADSRRIPGTKVFMGSSTGNMLVDEEKALENIFSKSPLPVITHCEDEKTIRENLQRYMAEYGDAIPVQLHPEIRSREACYLSSSRAVNLAKKYDTRLHIYHISTAEETELFTNKIPLQEKRITAEACIHHLWFNDQDYNEKGTLIKWNPAVKKEDDRKAIFKALLDDRIDVIATDHAPHTLEEKQNPYTSAPSGGPLVQHALPALMEFVRDEEMSIETLVQKACHNPAILFNIEERGFLREGFFADIVLVDAARPWTVTKENILSKCGWSPFEGTTFRSRVTHTFVNGNLVYDHGKIIEGFTGKRMTFDR
ncbi:MAG TPA: dihydroorotase [Cryomorphaceae bacterium]|nr:dihydroorotase [Owenweeksia sp.]MBF99917.1 dihydroorotase [Owenweeksia sp.]HAD98432.1 dihydroorotase [Cryomorphaceae bacterium]|tara:strand:- start:10265 stop:11605 length:1341 start_codon:yes stop_codon:yes gene_type:complete